MSRFFSSRYGALTPYTPGEQPKDQKYVKLNTNESPFPPAPAAMRMAAEEAAKLKLYSDPECRDLSAAAAEYLGIPKERIIFNNGSDETLNFAFMAFCDAEHPAVFPDITYGFYPVFAALNGIPYETLPLRDDFTVDVDAYVGVGKTVFLANPNAPTGIALPLSEIERIVAGNPDSVVVIDEAYVDFGGESAVPLTWKYDNLLVVGTFSKSRSLAGARLGFGIGAPALIADLNTIRYSTNPYNINRMTMAAGVGALSDRAYFENNCRTIMKTREWTAAELTKRGFTVLDSKANFVFASHPTYDGGELYADLKANGILVRHFGLERLKNFNRITIGSDEEMEILIGTIDELMRKKG